jgi:GGDEF domain-containing protein
MLFRWGGDEFLVLMFKLPEAEASRRMQLLNKILEENSEQWTCVEMKVAVSHGVSGFGSLAALGHAIEQADKAMYGRRQELRSATGRFGVQRNEVNPV